jgi:hypothetical protein
MGTRRNSSFSLFSLFSSKVSIVDHNRARIVIQKATDDFPNDPLLWSKRLSLLIEQSADSKTIKKEFKLACQNSIVKVKYHSPSIFILTYLLEFTFNLEYSS